MAILSSIIQRGTRASQPAANACAVGTLYFVTDEGVMERSNGATWDSQSAVTVTSGLKGLVPALDSNAAHYLDGTGNWSTPAGGGGGVYTPDMSRRQATITQTDTNDAALTSGKNVVGFGSVTTFGGGISTNVLDSTGGYFDFATGAVLGNTSGWANSGASQSRLDWLPKMFFVLELPATITSMRMWLGLTSSASLSTDTPTTSNIKFVGFRYSTDAADTFWMADLEKGDGATSQRTSTAVAIAASTRYVLGFNATSTTNVDFYVNGTVTNTFNTAGNFFASSQTLLPIIYVETRTAAARHMYMSRVWLEQT